MYTAADSIDSQREEAEITTLSSGDSFSSSYQVRTAAADIGSELDVLLVAGGWGPAHTHKIP